MFLPLKDRASAIQPVAVSMIELLYTFFVNRNVVLTSVQGPLSGSGKLEVLSKFCRFVTML
jgi:hypothetical protein